MNSSKTGFVPFGSYKTYYKIIGRATGKPPLLVLHGGPGSTHNYLLGLAELARLGDRQVIFYDQLGCGLSDRPDDNELWKIQTFIDELKAVLEHLNLENIHLFGHSWGGMLAIEYLLTQPKGISCAILASTMVSMPLYQTEVEKLKASLGSQVYSTLKKHEKAGTTDSSLYKWAYGEYSRQHLFRGNEFPDALRAPEGSNGDEAYKKMWGASEAYADGTLRDWDRIPDLHKIRIPTLITSGQYDELTPWQAAVTRDEIPNSSLRIITNGAHLVHVEQQETYNNIIEKFLTGVEAVKT